MNDKKKDRQILSIAGMVALIVLLVLCVKLIFAGLGAAIPQEGGASSGQSAQPSASQSQPVQEPEGAGTTDPAQSAPSFCPFCGEGLPSSFQWGQYCPYCGEQIEA